MEYENILHAVIPHYPMRVHDWQWTAPDTCLLHTNYGQKFLHRENEQARVQLRGQVLDALAKRGILRIPRYIRTVYGDPYIVLDNEVCTVVDRLRFYEIAMPRDLSIAMSNLSVLHEVLADLDVRAFSAASVAPSVSRVMADGVEVLERAQERCRSEVITPFCSLLLANFSAVRDRAHRNWRYVEETDHVRRDWSDGDQLILGHYDQTSIAFTDLGRIATLDFNGIAVGDQEVDVMTFCRSLYERGLGSDVLHALQAYKSRKGANRVWEQRIASVVGYPFAVVKVVTKYLESENRSELIWRTRLLKALTVDSGKP